MNNRIDFYILLKLLEPRLMNDAQELLNTMIIDQNTNKICSLKYFATSEGILEYVFWQTAAMKQVFEKYSEVICVDSTFNLNRSDYAVNIIITIDANRETRIVAFGLVSSDKRSDIITAFFEWFNSENSTFSKIRTILTDKNQSQIDVLKTLYPTADISLCLFHVFKAMKLETRKKVPSYVLQDIRGKMNYLLLMISY
jgi:hypothetical protein